MGARRTLGDDLHSFCILNNKIPFKFSDFSARFACAFRRTPRVRSAAHHGKKKDNLFFVDWLKGTL